MFAYLPDQRLKLACQFLGTIPRLLLSSPWLATTRTPKFNRPLSTSSSVVRTRTRIPTKRRMLFVHFTLSPASVLLNSKAHRLDFVLISASQHPKAPASDDDQQKIKDSRASNDEGDQIYKAKAKGESRRRWCHTQLPSSSIAARSSEFRREALRWSQSTW